MQTRLVLELPAATSTEEVAEIAARTLLGHGVRVFTELARTATLATSMPEITAYMFTYTQ